LPERQRQVVVLRFVGDLAEAAIGNVLGVKRGTVASNLSRALDALTWQVQQETS
jgi:DNA-directed RNA polymerase specialized sigma24 family protein